MYTKEFPIWRHYFVVPCVPSFFWYLTMCFHTATDWARVTLSGNSSRKCLIPAKPFLSRNTSSVSTSLEQCSMGVWSVHMNPTMQLAYAMFSQSIQCPTCMMVLRWSHTKDIAHSSHVSIHIYTLDMHPLARVALFGLALSYATIYRNKSSRGLLWAPTIVLSRQ